MLPEKMAVFLLRYVKFLNLLAHNLSTKNERNGMSVPSIDNIVSHFPKIVTPCKIIIITSIFGNYDKLSNPLFDYAGMKHCFHAYGDNSSLQLCKPWKLHRVNVPGVSTRDLSRIPKMLAFKWVMSPYILYVDGKHQLKLNPHFFIPRMGYCYDIAILLQPNRNTIEQEYNWIRKNRCYQGALRSCSLLDEQWALYKKKTPLAPAYEGSYFLLRRRENMDFMKYWFLNYSTYFKRDQLSLDHVLSAENVSVMKLGRQFHYKPSGQRAVTKAVGHIVKREKVCYDQISKDGIIPFVFFPSIFCHFYKIQ